MNLEQTCQKVITLCKHVGSFLENSVNHVSDDMITVKASMDFVTQIDKESEQQLVEGLAIILPEAGFIAEEGTSNKVGERYDWIIDPIDGTTNFIHGVSPFCISIALRDNEELILGVIYDPIQKECFYAWKEGGAWLNGKAISVSDKKKLNESLIATGFPYTDFSLIDEYMASLRVFMTKTHGIRRLGSAAMDLAYVACGRYDAFYEYHLKPWDVAAGSVLIKEAGGKVCDFKGGNNYLFGEDYVGSNGEIHSEFMDVIHLHFK
ncbi:MAG: inositol monophosphatase [Bacteroidales bacterium]|nr:inositol monophosphatase [Bacteroidales bacterium]